MMAAGGIPFCARQARAAFQTQGAKLGRLDFVFASGFITDRTKRGNLPAHKQWLEKLGDKGYTSILLPVDTSSPHVAGDGKKTQVKNSNSRVQGGFLGHD